MATEWIEKLNLCREYYMFFIDYVKIERPGNYKLFKFISEFPSIEPNQHAIDYIADFTEVLELGYCVLVSLETIIPDSENERKEYYKKMKQIKNFYSNYVSVSGAEYHLKNIEPIEDGKSNLNILHIIMHKQNKVFLEDYFLEEKSDLPDYWSLFKLPNPAYNLDQLFKNSNGKSTTAITKEIIDIMDTIKSDNTKVKPTKNISPIILGINKRREPNILSKISPFTFNNNKGYRKSPIPSTYYQEIWLQKCANTIDMRIKFLNIP